MNLVWRCTGIACLTVVACAEPRATSSPVTGRASSSATSAPVLREAITHVVPSITCVTMDRLSLDVSAKVRWRVASQETFDKVSGGDPGRLNARLDDVVNAELRVSLANRPASEAFSQPAMARVSALVREAASKYGVEVLEVTAAGH